MLAYVDRGIVVQSTRLDMLSIRGSNAKSANMFARVLEWISFVFDHGNERALWSSGYEVCCLYV